MVTEERAKQMAQPPAQKGQTKGEQPAAAQPAAPAATGSTTPAPAAPPAATAEKDNTKRTVRSVGPTFIAPATK